MPVKRGNIKQSKFVTSVAATTITAFTLPAQAMITHVHAYGAAGTGTITLQARPINSATPVTFATVDATLTAPGSDGALTGTIPYNRQSVPMVITVQGSTTGNASLEVEYA